MIPLIRKEIKRRMKEAKEKWMSDKCRQVAKLYQRDKGFDVYRKNEERQTGNVIDYHEVEEKVKIWQQYIHGHFKDDSFRKRKTIICKKDKIAQ